MCFSLICPIPSHERVYKDTVEVEMIFYSDNLPRNVSIKKYFHWFVIFSGRIRLLLFKPANSYKQACCENKAADLF